VQGRKIRKGPLSIEQRQSRRVLAKQFRQLSGRATKSLRRRLQIPCGGGQSIECLGEQRRKVVVIDVDGQRPVPAARSPQVRRSGRGAGADF
jgi:hypothetical protein